MEPCQSLTSFWYLFLIKASRLHLQLLSSFHYHKENIELMNFVCYGWHLNDPPQNKFALLVLLLDQYQKCYYHEQHGPDFFQMHFPQHGHNVPEIFQVNPHLQVILFFNNNLIVTDMVFNFWEKASLCSRYFCSQKYLSKYSENII